MGQTCTLTSDLYKIHNYGMGFKSNPNLNLLQVQDEDGRWMIVGIVSNGPSVCGMQPVVFHKVDN